MMVYKSLAVPGEGSVEPPPPLPTLFLDQTEIKTKNKNDKKMEKLVTWCLT